MALLVGLLALACTAQIPIQGGFGASVPGHFTPVRFQTIRSGTDATTNRSGLFVFNEPNSWESYWRENHKGPIPTLERGFFTRWRILAIRSGNRPTGGYGLGVRQILRRVDKATVCAIESIPPNNSRPRRGETSPWAILQVELGAFDFELQTQRFAGYAGATTLPAGSQVKIGGATVTFGPGYGYGCDHCDHYGRGACHCQGGKDCDCRKG